MESMEPFSRRGMVKLSLTSRPILNLGTKSDSIWRNATSRDFNVSGRSSSVSSYRVYQFLSNYKQFEGQLIVNKTAGLPESELVFKLDLELYLDVQFQNEAGFIVSLIYQKEGGGFGKTVPIFKAEALDSSAGGGLVRMISCSKKVDLHRRREQRWKREDWVNGRCSFKKYIADNTEIFFQDMTFMMTYGYLIPLRLRSWEGLNPKYLRRDGSLPSCLPRTGIFEETNSGIQVVISYTAEKMEVNRVQKLWFDMDFIVDIASAMIMTKEHQTGLTAEQYVNYEEGLSGSPSQLTGVHEVHLHSQFGYAPFLARAWYTNISEQKTYGIFKWKLIVVKQTEFIILLHDGVWHFRHVPTED